MKLYGSLTSPYVRKIRIILQEKAIDCEFITTNPFESDSPVATLNPLGKVPTLVLDDEHVLFNSPLIAEYLDSLSTPALIPASGPARWQILTWQALADGIYDAAATRFLETKRPTEQQSTDAMQRQADKIEHALSYAAQHVQHDHNLVDQQFSLADISLGVALAYIDLRYNSNWRTQYPTLETWQTKIVARDSFKSTAPPVQ